MRPLLDSTVPLLLRGYTWLPAKQRRTADGHGPGEAPPVRARLLGRPAVFLSGPEAVSFFYDEQHVRRAGALPDPVLDTLFGQGAVHTLDGDPHRARKALFTGLLMEPEAVAELTDTVVQHWRAAVERWPDRGRVTLFDEVAVVLAEAVCAWAGLPHTGRAAARTARDCVAMVDGFATPGPRHWRARRARARQERVLARTVERARAKGARGKVLQRVAGHRDADGELLPARTAAVELLNIVRPTVALAWFVTFGAHALHRDPALREELRVAQEPSFERAFAHEVRRFYPFAPFVGGLAVTDLTWRGEPIAAGSMVLLDLYGQNHDPGLWHEPYRFDPGRFLGRPPGRDELVPQGGGDAHHGHRCPGEDIAVAVVGALCTELARLEFEVPPEQDLRIPLHRMPTRPRSGFVIATGPRARTGSEVPAYDSLPS
ncbi:cytochrome P450 [Streptomyces sp. WAC06614]|uniref:cytochrome P450 n=1 Tax=Streptomyces sp. WAC06614 TaxID=2487416 RepID=UPI000F7957DF|nr:cytochrome P450 [Streptomyces sp. WAC06614]RSS83283.1 cytochrome P450 [Streptomyces sp. WAC06614]